MSSHANRCIILLLLLASFGSLASAQPRILDANMHHLRNGNEIEWENFSSLPVQSNLVIHFTGARQESPYTISLRQYDVKQYWRIIINDRIIDSLIVDGNDMKTYFNLPAGSIREGENELRIEAATGITDEIEVGQILLDERPMDKVLSEAHLELELRDSQSNQLIPGRFTITDTKGVLQSIGTKSQAHLAVRPGMVYTGNGKATLQLPAGEYIIYAGRGFEYGVDSFHCTIQKGQGLIKKFRIKKEVETNGWVSCDTHIHSLTRSGHGDATENERALTIAGEGIELPVITEHNLISDISALAKQLKMEKFYTVIPGDEVTTPVGHFNYFPLSSRDSAPDYKVKDWAMLKLKIDGPGGKMVVLNHARDIHNGFRPFGTDRHIAIAGLDLENWVLPANAMEVVNSGALLSDRMRLFLDWFGLLNRGIRLTPAGGSDSHDVGRYIVGQARTYIQTKDDAPGAINIEDAVSNFKKGKVMVSFGLMPAMRVNKNYGSGDLVPASNDFQIEVHVSGPSWINADRVSLYANGIKIHEAFIKNKKGAGLKWSGRWSLKFPKQDVFLVAIAEGEQKSLPFWPIVKPFQPTGPAWSPYVIGCTGAVWIDADGDGKPTPAYEYAKRLIEKFANDPEALVVQLNNYDEAVAIQAASLLYQNNIDVNSSSFISALKLAKSSTAEGIRKFTEALKLSSKK